MNLQEQIEQEAQRLNEAGKSHEGANEGAPEGTNTQAANQEFDFVAHYTSLTGSQFQSKDEAEASIKEIFTKYNELKDLPDKFIQAQQEVETYKAKYQKVSEAVDPLKYFANPESYIREQLIIKYPEYDPASLTKAITSTDLSPIEALIIGRKLNDSDIYKTDADAIADIEETYGIDLSEEFDQLPSAKRNAILKEAKSYKQRFAELKNSVELPQALNPETMAQERIEQLRQQQDVLKQSWKPFVETLTNQLDKVSITKGDQLIFEFAIDDAFKTELAKRTNDTLEFLAQKGITFDDNAKAALVGELKQTYLINNLPVIMERYASEKIAAVDEATFRELHNPKPANQTQDSPARSSVDRSREAAEQQIAQSLGFKI